MGWESRKGKGRYFTRSRREDGRIVRQYVRADEAELAAREDEERRRQKREQRQAERIDMARLREMGDRLEDYCRRVNADLESALALAGYRRHNRGEWRKTRPPAGTRKDETTMAKRKVRLAASAGSEPPAGVTPRLSQEDKEIILKARQGEESARDGMREIVARYGPRGMSPLADIVRDGLLEQVCDESIAMYEDIRYQMVNLRGELAGPASGPLEHLLADRVALCWLHVHYFELRVSKHLGSDSPKQSEYYQRCLESAHRRYLGSIRSLAQVRRLQLPSVQLNLANQQINVADRQVNLTPATRVENGAQANGDLPGD